MGLIKTGIKAAVAVKVGHMVHDRIEARKQAEREAQGVPAGATTPPSIGPSAAVAPSGRAGDDTLDQLARLGELRSSGVLTEAEFEEQKARILAR